MFDDVLRILCEQIPEHLDVETRTDLPGDIAPPLVQLVEIPGGTYRHRPWNGPALTEQYDIDVITFSASDGEDAEGIARDRAHAVRDWLELWTHPRIQLTERKRPARLPDYNPHLMRFGQTIGVLAHRVTDTE